METTLSFFMSVSFLPLQQGAVFGSRKPKDTLIFSTLSNTTFGHTSFIALQCFGNYMKLTVFNAVSTGNGGEHQSNHNQDPKT